MVGTWIILHGARIVFFLAVAIEICNEFFRELALTAAVEICYGAPYASKLVQAGQIRYFSRAAKSQGSTLRRSTELSRRLTSKGGFMFGLGVQELLIILVIALVLFGPSKLPQIGSGLGKAIRDFKKGISGEEPEGGAKDERAAKKEDGKELPH
jgi:sec-independent protein translocase protein TatA